MRAQGAGSIGWPHPLHPAIEGSLAVVPFPFSNPRMNDNFPSGRMLTMAVAGGYTRLAVKCPGYGRYAELPWHEARKPFTTRLPGVPRAMRCKRCGAKPDRGTLTNQSIVPGAPRRPGALPIYEVRTDGAVLLVG